MIIAETEHLLLRDFTQMDIPKRVEWETVEREWQNWDGPWVFEGMSEEAHRQRAERIARELKQFALMHERKSEQDTRYAFQLELKESGEYIGCISCYCINDHYDYTDDDGYFAFGIDIPPVHHRGKGYGFEALSAAVRYLSAQGLEEMYLQTWSGNVPMVKLAEKLGFTEIQRRKDARTVRGSRYDALTFRKKLFNFKADTEAMCDPGKGE